MKTILRLAMIACAVIIAASALGAAQQTPALSQATPMPLAKLNQSPAKPNEKK
jgi:hypothetical protein